MDAANDNQIHKDPFDEQVHVCEHHYDRMKAAVQGVGLWHRVSRDHAHLRARAKRFDPYDIDPLFLLHSMIMGKARHMAALNGVTIEGDRCPVCFFDVGVWIDEAVIAVSQRLKRLDDEKLADQVRNIELEARERG